MDGFIDPRTPARFNIDDMAHMENLFDMPLFSSTGPDLRSAGHWLWQVEAAELEGSFFVAEKLFELALHSRAEPREEILRAQREFRARYSSVLSTPHSSLASFPMDGLYIPPLDMGEPPSLQAMVHGMRRMEDGDPSPPESDHLDLTTSRGQERLVAQIRLSMNQGSASGTPLQPGTRTNDSGERSKESHGHGHAAGKSVAGRKATQRRGAGLSAAVTTSVATAWGERGLSTIGEVSKSSEQKKVNSRQRTVSDELVMDSVTSCSVSGVLMPDMAAMNGPEGGDRKGSDGKPSRASSNAGSTATTAGLFPRYVMEHDKKVRELKRELCRRNKKKSGSSAAAGPGSGRPRRTGSDSQAAAMVAPAEGPGTSKASRRAQTVSSRRHDSLSDFVRRFTRKPVKTEGSSLRATIELTFSGEKLRPHPQAWFWQIMDIAPLPIYQPPFSPVWVLRGTSVNTSLQSEQEALSGQLSDTLGPHSVFSSPLGREDTMPQLDHDWPQEDLPPPLPAAHPAAAGNGWPSAEQGTAAGGSDEVDELSMEDMQGTVTSPPGVVETAAEEAQDAAAGAEVAATPVIHSEALKREEQTDTLSAMETDPAPPSGTVPEVVAVVPETEKEHVPEPVVILASDAAAAIARDVSQEPEFELFPTSRIPLTRMRRPATRPIGSILARTGLAPVPKIRDRDPALVLEALAMAGKAAEAPAALRKVPSAEKKDLEAGVAAVGEAVAGDGSAGVGLAGMEDPVGGDTSDPGFEPQVDAEESPQPGYTSQPASAHGSRAAVSGFGHSWPQSARDSDLLDLEGVPVSSVSISTDALLADQELLPDQQQQQQPKKKKKRSEELPMVDEQGLLHTDSTDGSPAFHNRSASGSSQGSVSRSSRKKWEISATSPVTAAAMSVLSRAPENSNMANVAPLEANEDSMEELDVDTADVEVADWSSRRGEEPAGRGVSDVTASPLMGQERVWQLPPASLAAQQYGPPSPIHDWRVGEPSPWPEGELLPSDLQDGSDDSEGFFTLSEDHIIGSSTSAHMWPSLHDSSSRFFATSSNSSRNGLHQGDGGPGAGAGKQKPSKKLSSIWVAVNPVGRSIKKIFTKGPAGQAGNGAAPTASVKPKMSDSMRASAAAGPSSGKLRPKRRSRSSIP